MDVRQILSRALGGATVLFSGFSASGEAGILLQQSVSCVMAVSGLTIVIKLGAGIYISVDDSTVQKY